MSGGCHGGSGGGPALHAELARLLAEGWRVAVATVIRGRGSRPRREGAKMLVLADGRTIGTIGGGALEASVTADCAAALAEGRPRTETYALAESGENSVGMTCGGTVEVFIDVEQPARRLVIFGAGHVGRALAAAATVGELAVTVVDDRSEWLEPRAFPGGATLRRCGRDYGTDLPEVGADDLVAIMTRCHATDLAVLKALAPRPFAYLGMIGSRRKILRAKTALEEAGVPGEWLDRIHGPIGLDIGAETPGEIALAVAAELVSVIRSSPHPAPAATVET